MVEGVGVSDEQLDEWDEDTRASVLAFGSSRSNERVLALLGEVRASHAREAALQQCIDKALEECADSVFALKPPCSGLVSIESVRAALTGTDIQSTEETP